MECPAEGCLATFPYESSLTNHLSSSHGNSEVLQNYVEKISSHEWYCTLCKKTFGSRIGAITHIGRVHCDISDFGGLVVNENNNDIQSFLEVEMYEDETGLVNLKGDLFDDAIDSANMDMDSDLADVEDLIASDKDDLKDPGMGNVAGDDVFDKHLENMEVDQVVIDSVMENLQVKKNQGVVVGINRLANADAGIPPPGCKPVAPVSASNRVISPPATQPVIPPPPASQRVISPPGNQRVISPPAIQDVIPQSAIQPRTPPPAGSYENPLYCGSSSDDEGLPSPLHRLAANGFSVTKF